MRKSLAPHKPYHPLFHKALFLVVIVLAIGFRLYGMNWDQGEHYHPDERAIVMTVSTLTFPDGLNPKFFAYGSLPFYLLKFVGFILAKLDPTIVDYAHSNLLGRILSALFDVGTLGMIYLIGRLLFNRTMGIISAYAYATSTLAIQLSHFFAVDTLLTFFSTSTIYFVLRFQKNPTATHLSMVAVSVAMALATKISAIILFVPIAISLYLSIQRNWKHGLHLTLLFIFIVLTVFFLCQPYTFLDFETFWEQIQKQQEMTRDPFTFPYTLQYVGITPYWYPILNIFLWGLSPIHATISFIGLLYLGIHTKHTKKIQLFTIGVFTLLYFAVVGKFAIGFIRYMLPLYPFFALGFGFFLTHFLSHKRILRNVLLGTLLLWPLSFMAIYTKENTRNSASSWILYNVPAGSTFAVEHWDDLIPSTGYDDLYKRYELPLYDSDSNEKWDQITFALRKSDYIVIASHRLYVPLMKLTDCAILPQKYCYTKTARYYTKLFNGTLGFTKIKEFRVLPTIPILGIPIDDITADESFTVYDHPKVILFKKTTVNDAFLEKELRQL